MLWETKQSRAWEGEEQKCRLEASFHFKKVRVGLNEKRTFQQRITGREGVSPAVSQEEHLRQKCVGVCWPEDKVQGEGDRGRGPQRDRDNWVGGWKRSASALQVMVRTVAVILSQSERHCRVWQESNLI